MIKIATNGQWTLAKSSEDKPGPAPTSLHGLIGKTHTVEVHPHIDHLYGLKNHIQSQPKKSMQLADIKRSQFGHLADKLPRDAKGRVTPEMIDKHIAGLPKHKVEIKVVPYEEGAQQHRNDVPQYAVSVGLHPDTLKTMSPNSKNAWDYVRSRQHNLKGHDHQIGWARVDPYKIDNGSYPGSRNIITPNEGHWHIDEIQSDFGVPKTLEQHIKNYTDPDNIFGNIKSAASSGWREPSDDQDHNQLNKDLKAFAETYPELVPHLNTLHQSHKDRDRAKLEAFAARRADGSGSSDTPGGRYDTPEEIKALMAKYRDIEQQHEARIKPFTDSARSLAEKISKDREGLNHKHMFNLLSHGHEDPMHMVHSAINQLGRQNGIESMSMDTPNHQAHQSGLRPSNAPEEKYNRDEAHDQVIDHIQRGGVDDGKVNRLWQQYGQNALAGNNHDIHFKSASEKLGPEGLEEFASLVPKDNSSWMFNGHRDDWDSMVADNGPYHREGTLVQEHNNKGFPEISGLSLGVLKKLQNMTNHEKDALSRFANDYNHHVIGHLAEELGYHYDDDDSGHHPDYAEYDDLPVHQVNTYDKRPKKLGFQTVDKKSVLGEHPEDEYDQVQYAKLHKKLRLIQELLRKASD